MKKIALLAIGLLMVCNCAFAAVVTTNFDLGTLAIDTPYVSPVILKGAGVEFQDNFIFNLPNSDLTGAATSLEVSFVGAPTAVFDISNFAVKLFSGTPTGENSQIGTTFTSIVDNIQFSSLSMLSGSYFIAISGLASGAYGGNYYTAFTAKSPVPVPAAALLLGAGLLGIVGIRRRQVS